MWKPTNTYSYNPQNELYHHGILGMSWGKRNGPPYPLNTQDHSAAERKAGWRKSLGGGSSSSVKSKKKQQKAFAKKVIRRNSMQPANTYDRQLVEDMKKAVDPEKMKAYKEASKELNDIANLEDEFFESKDRYDASAKAYDDTYKWFEKNDPEYLNSIIKDNNGNKETLDQYHDFRKTYEGYEDEAWTIAQDNYLKKHGYSENAWNESYDRFKKAETEVVLDLVGKYGNKRYKNKGNKKSSTVNQLVGSYLKDI